MARLSSLQFQNPPGPASWAAVSADYGNFVPIVVESTGSIETVALAASAKVGDSVKLIFRALDESEPPYTCRIVSPGGKVLLERVLRELPDGKPQSAPPLAFTAGAAGEYKVEIWQLYGAARGQAVLMVDEVVV